MTSGNHNNSEAVERLITVSTEKAINLFEAGYANQAIEFYRDILSALPEDFKATLILAKMYKKAGNRDEALPLLQKIPPESFYYADALFTLGLTLMERRDFRGGVECFHKLINLDILNVDGYNNLAMCLMELGQPEEAQKYLLHSIEISPEDAKTHLYLGNLFARYWRLGEAREQFQTVITLDYKNVGAYSNLSGIALLEGEIAEAVALLHTALKLQPNYCIAADNLLLNMNYPDQYTPEQIRDEHFRLADIYGVAAQEKTQYHRRSGNKIRVGYVSGDFRSHSVAFFLEPVLRNHSRDGFEIYCYDMVTAPDATTRRMMGLGWEWRPIYGLSDKTVADLILSDDIDILVDLAGHTLGNRLGVFAMCPAPVQATWLGYPNTTGLKQIDYRLTDSFADPAGMTDHLYSEELVRLPLSFLCYSPPDSAPQVAPMPDGPVTFCCFNNYPKISDTVLKLWARVLKAIPDARLMLKCGSLEDLRVRTQLKGRFAALGVDPSRLLLDRFTVHREEHLQRYGSCHIALDTYPYNGTTTTCEALWMGVPVITLAGRTHASRVGLSILENSGLPEFIAQNADQYVEIVVRLANDSERLLQYRHKLRGQLSSSPLTDAVRFTRDLEAAYLDMRPTKMTTEPPIIDTSVQRFIAISIEKVIKLYEVGYADEALAQCADILSVYPDSDEVAFKLARLYGLVNRPEDALPLLKRIDTHSPYYADSLYMRGMMLGDRRDFTGAVDCLTLLLEIDDSRVECINNLARFLMELDRPGDAQNYLFKSLQMLPDCAETHLFLGNLFSRYWQLGEARQQFQRVIELQPDHAGAYNNLAGIAVLERNIDEALSLLRAALKLQPNYYAAADNLLFYLNYSDKYTPEQVRDEHFRLAELYSVPPREHLLGKCQPGDKIRIGYVSGDFRSHSVAFFLEPVLCNHNRDHFEIYCYDMVTAPDNITRRMMGLGWKWRTVYGLSDSTVADLIVADGIDILIDLSGHSQGNRLGVFALRPAPAQVTWLGYPNTTGLNQMDYRLTDDLSDPAGMTDHLYSEKLLRLPQSFLCYAPPDSAPEVTPLSSEPFTFCCFNNHAKISDTILRLWAKILLAVPGSKLLLKNGSMGNAQIAANFSNQFSELGIDPRRLILENYTFSREEHLQRYAACHIALDTYPYNGTTTTCEALWMGVPVVTLAGTSHASRVGLSILENCGLGELIVHDADQYVQQAIALANAPERLLQYRLTLREQLSSSPLTDAERFTRDLETVYREMISEDVV